MVTISLCMIVKNEEDTIERCLRSVEGIVDEIIIADTGSTDKTKELCQKFTDKIYDFKWINDFSAARNFAFSHATMDYTLWLDADDIILPEDAEKFKAFKKTLSPDVDAVMMRYNTGFNEKGEVTFSYFRERLSKRSRNFQWAEPVHEYLQMYGNIINTEICITHAKQKYEKSDRNLKIYQSILASGRKLSPRGMYYYARELKDHGLYGRAIRQFNRFLDSGKGWVEDNITACGELSKCHFMKEEPEKALKALLRSFQYDTPRGEIVCQIGYYFKSLKDYQKAVFWFEFILSLKKPEGSWGFIQHDSWGYTPCIECAVCYDKLGDLEKAEYYNNLAGEYHPDSKAFLHNKQYFEARRKEKD